MKMSLKSRANRKTIFVSVSKLADAISRMYTSNNCRQRLIAFRLRLPMKASLIGLFKSTARFRFHEMFQKKKIVFFMTILKLYEFNCEVLFLILFFSSAERRREVIKSRAVCSIIPLQCKWNEMCCWKTDIMQLGHKFYLNFVFLTEKKNEKRRATVGSKWERKFSKLSTMFKAKQLNYMKHDFVIDFRQAAFKAFNFFFAVHFGYKDFGVVELFRGSFLIGSTKR